MAAADRAYRLTDPATRGACTAEVHTCWVCLRVSGCISWVYLLGASVGCVRGSLGVSVGCICWEYLLGVSAGLWVYQLGVSVGCICW
eukprot:3433565-Pyramimonas_sp.AAC.1